MLNEDVMYDALVNKDPSFEGLFYVGVTTTGIFCRPTCTAKKPKRTNVEFFSTSGEAIVNGYRPCKICSPLNKPGETPEAIKKIMEEISSNPFIRLKDQDLRERGIEPDTLRRWFRKNHGITFHSFQRMQRINSAFMKIRNGEKVADVAFESGYDSLSGFAEQYKSLIGASPSNSRNTTLLNLMRIDTPLGPMIACACDEGICLLEFTDRKMLETQIKNICRLMKASIIQGTNGHLDTLSRQLEEYFAGKRKNFTVPLVFPGTAFQQKVWNALLQIPYGQTRSYKAQSEIIGMPNAMRAVANANGCNRIGIIIPCHRVIGEDGSLTGYGGGLWRKQWLLELERNNC